MTPDRQEALSHQHYGYWCVPLAGGAIAVFSHPNGKLLDICQSWAGVLAIPLPPFHIYQSPEVRDIDLGDLL